MWFGKKKNTKESIKLNEEARDSVIERITKEQKDEGTRETKPEPQKFNTSTKRQFNPRKTTRNLKTTNRDYQYKERLKKLKLQGDDDLINITTVMTDALGAMAMGNIDINMDFVIDLRDHLRSMSTRMRKQEKIINKITTELQRTESLIFSDILEKALNKLYYHDATLESSVADAILELRTLRTNAKLRTTTLPPPPTKLE